VKKMNIDVNYFAVLLAAVAAMAVGFAWYSPVMFGKPWMKLMGYTTKSIEEAKKGMGKMYALSMAASLITAYVLTHIMVMSINFFQSDPLSTGLTSAFWVWLGFVAPVQMTDVIFGGKQWKLFSINTGYQLTSLLIMGIVLSLWM